MAEYIVNPLVLGNQKYKLWIIQTRTIWFCQTGFKARLV